MQSWEDQFGDMRAQFIARSGERLRRLEDMILALQVDSANLTLLSEVRQQFHWLAGVGGTYGMNLVTNIGSLGEDFCDSLRAASNPPAPRDVERLQALLASVRAAFQGKDVSISELEKQLSLSQVPDSQGAGILLVESDSASQSVLNRLLSEEGLRVDVCASVADAKRKLAERPYDAVIVSIPLPDGSGYELTEFCRALPEGQRITIAILSRKTGFLDKVNAIHAGADVFFEHPLELKYMVEKLIMLLSKGKPQMYRILHVEDDPDQSFFVRAALEAAGYNVVSLNDPAGFEQWMLAVQPDLVLLDVMLGKLTGFDLARYMRQDERYSAIPVLFLTTQNQLHAHIESARVGADDHLIKPVPPPLLCAAIASRLERARVLKGLTSKDGLTKCLTHSAFMQKAQAILSRQSRSGRISMLVIDVDYLRGINFKFGFGAGDRVLLALAKLIQQRFRHTDIVGRIGDDQFGIVLEHLQEAEMAQLASMVLGEFAKLQHTADDTSESFRATFSGGVCMLEEGMNLESWVNLAEQALQMAKKQGRNCIIKATARVGR